MSAPKLLSKEEDYVLFKKKYLKAIINKKDSFEFKGNYYLTKFAKELIMTREN